MSVDVMDADTMDPETAAGGDFSGDRLLELYDRVAEAPDAVERLRRLVLDLAVRGRLVEQDPADEPASELLKRIEKEKERMVKAVEIRRKKKIARSVSSGRPFAVPPGWEWVQFGEIGLFGSSSRVHKRDWSAQGVPFYRAREIVKLAKNGTVENELYISEELYSKLTSRGLFPEPDDLMITGVGTIGVAYVVKGHDHFYFKDASVLIFKNIFNLPAPYLQLFCSTPYWFQTIHKASMGTTVHTLTIARANPVLVPLPPLAEQHRIVARVDELMALLNRLEEARTTREATRDRLTAAVLTRLTAPDAATPDIHLVLNNLPALTTRPDQIRTFRQTILNLAVRGKLVEQDPEDEPAEELLERIDAAKKEAKRETGDRRIKPAPRPDARMLSGHLPTGWAAQSFENLFLFVDYRGRTPPKTDDGIPLITAKNVRMGHLNREPREYISKTTFDTWMTRGIPKDGDLFFTTEAPLANVCINEITEPFALAQRVICLQPYAEIDTRFMMYAMMSDVLQGSIEEQATGLTAKGIKAAKLKPLALPIPPLAEQRRIVAKVDELMELCDRMEAVLVEAGALRQELLEAVLHDVKGGDTLQDHQAVA